LNRVLLVFSHIDGMRSVHHLAQFLLVEMRSWGIFCPGWLQSAILLISASWVARIVGVSHWCWASVLFLKIRTPVLPELFLHDHSISQLHSQLLFYLG
jgi:hypothetical protein